MAYWGNSDPTWLALSPTQKVAAMALLEADNRGGSPDLPSAVNVVGAMINRAQASGEDLGRHASSRAYQPTIEDSQRARLAEVIRNPNFNALAQLAESRLSGQTPDWVGGATHFLAPPSTMLALEAREPGKYRSWRGWTGYDPKTGQYANTVMADSSHVFLKPDENKAGTAASSTSQGDRSVNPLALLSLFGGKLGGLGNGGAAIPSMASAAGGGVDTLGSINPLSGAQNLFGNLSTLGGGQNQQGDADMALAGQAQKQADSPDQAMQPMMKKPFDMGQLQSLLQQWQQRGLGSGMQPQRLG